MVATVEAGGAAGQDLLNIHGYPPLLAMRKPKVSQQDQCVSRNEQCAGRPQKVVSTSRITML
jgi:hypothetical protein